MSINIIDVPLVRSRDGFTLACCGTDGTVAVMFFQGDELGERVSDEEFGYV